jgi:hypothetical protein
LNVSTSASHFHPCAAEHQRGGGIFHVEDARECRRPVGPADDVGDLSDSRHLARHRFLASDRHACRILQVTTGDRQDPRRHRRREERRLTGDRSDVQNGIEVLGKPHVEHLVGLVENQHVQGAELQRFSAQVIQCATRGCHDDVPTPLQCGNLAEQVPSFE